AQQQWALETGALSTATPALSSLKVYLGRGGNGSINGTGQGAVKCPSGGSYTASPVSTAPTCTLSDSNGHKLP
ncbi:MAG TPA: hypothetical protein VG938_07080, partial [Verrucomicrobiae bacterium]|nr:hypothetical protein [Verrucomicrobiae bacterium]